MKPAAGLSRNSVAAAISAGVPTRPALEASVIAFMAAACGPLSSAWPMGVAMTPGLIVLTRAPRAPQIVLDA
jgi:hypothetical protein